MAESTKEQVIEFISSMSVLDLSEMVKELEDNFGVSAAVPVAVAAAPGAGAGAPAVEEEKTSFDVVLNAAGDKKINVIKEVRTLTGLGLKEAKALVDAAPPNVLEGVDKETAEKAKEAIEAVGGSVELK